MPIYEYRCDKGHTFEVMQRMTDDQLTACEVCGAPVQKVLHSPAVHFKGSGFYTTDYGKKKKGAGGGAGAGAKENGSSGSSSDSSSPSDSSSSSDSKSSTADAAKSASKSD